MPRRPIPPSPARRPWLRAAAGLVLAASVPHPVDVIAAAARHDDPRRPDRPVEAIDPRAASVAHRIAPGVWAFRGLAGDISPESLGRHGNGGFVVGPTGVLVIDSGVSAQEGAERLAAVRSATERPIRALLLTQASQEFIFGAAPFQDQGIPVLMHEDAARLMSARCENCLRNLRRELGEAAMAGSRVPRADRLFSTADGAGALVDIGRDLRFVTASAGRRTATPGATALFDPAGSTLFAGPLLDGLTVPDLQDADLEAWAAARQDLRKLAAAHVVPGRGPVGTGAMIDDCDAYVAALEVEVERFLKDGRPLSEISEGIELPRFRDWDRYETTHRRNASILYLRRERDLLLK